MRLPLVCTWIFVAVACADPAKDGDGPSDDDDVAADTDPADADLTESDDADTDPPADSDGAADTDLVDTDAADTADSDVADTSLTGDGDGVPDRLERCPGLDDRVDLDADLVPDCTQTVLTNAQLSADITGWVGETDGGRVVDTTWSTDDASGWRRSGSVEVVNRTRSVGDVDSGVLSVCLPVNDDRLVDVFYRYRVPTRQGPGLALITGLVSFLDDACAVPNAGVSLLNQPGTVIDGAWHVMDIGQPFDMTVHASGSVQLRITIEKPANRGPVRFSVDDVLVRLR
jgi:hypothetical protein